MTLNNTTPDYEALGLAMLNAQAEDQKTSVPYRPYMNAITEKVTATILLQQIWFWWKLVGGRPFFKFRAPCEKHNLYKEGDSWTEELGFSGSEFDSALKTIATKITRGVSKNAILAERKPTSLVIYWTDANRVTWYQVNESLYAKCAWAARNKPELLTNWENLKYLDNCSLVKNISETTLRDLDSIESPPSADADCSGEQSLGETESKRKRTITPWERTRHELADEFTRVTGIKLPTRGQGVFKHRQARWYGPLRTIYDAAGEDVPKAKGLIAQVVSDMRKDKLTIASPQSIEQLAIAKAAEMPQKGAGMTAW